MPTTDLTTTLADLEELREHLRNKALTAQRRYTFAPKQRTTQLEQARKATHRADAVDAAIRWLEKTI